MFNRAPMRFFARLLFGFAPVGQPQKYASINQKFANFAAPIQLRMGNAITKHQCPRYFNILPKQ
jgi:hypothetical protein